VSQRRARTGVLGSGQRGSLPSSSASQRASHVVRGQPYPVRIALEYLASLSTRALRASRIEELGSVQYDSGARQDCPLRVACEPSSHSACDSCSRSPSQSRRRRNDEPDEWALGLGVGAETSAHRQGRRARRRADLACKRQKPADRTVTWSSSDADSPAAALTYTVQARQPGKPERP
jgi:hypothetical protein